MHIWSGYPMNWAMGLGMMLMWLVIVLVIGGIWTWSVNARGAWRPRDDAKQVVRRRFARGEIDSDTLNRMLSQLDGERAPGGPTP